MLDVKVPVLFVIGGPGSGKGTQCDKIVQKYGFTHLSLGDLLRQECETGTDRGTKFAEIMEKGQLIGNDEAMDVLKDAITKRLADAKGFLIDGYPRDVRQVDAFEKQVCQCSSLLFIDVPDDLMESRLLERGKTSGRKDDNEDTIVQRLTVFHEHTQPILDTYGNKVQKIEGTGTPDEIFERVVNAIDKFMKL